MKLFVLLISIFMVLSLREVKADEIIEVTPVENEVIASELRKEAESPEHDKRTKEYLKRVSELFGTAKTTIELEVKTYKKDCANCSGEQKAQTILTKLGRYLGRGAAWLSTITGKPFMAAAGFVKGTAEKKESNKEILALYKFFLNHQEEFDELYLQAGTPKQMGELMLAKMEEIMQKKSYIIMKDFLTHLGITRDIPEDMKKFELTPEEIATIEKAKISPDFINSHPEFQEVKPLVGEFSRQEAEDLVMSGYFAKAISFENYKTALPSVPELVGAIAGQLYIPKTALGIVSKTAAGLYTTPVVAADIGTGISTAICLQPETQEKFAKDEDLKSFCSFVTNKTGYELMKSRAKGYIAGRKFQDRVSAKIREYREKREEQKRLKGQLH